ncbi:MAG: type 2 isopentenyl-diphosphate Delta-isomerase [Desulfurococcales archaeon]|nr:type 2 isopentenyl-diphosphate Delta-isomerase [Desulfurococcales archaeon]
MSEETSSRKLDHIRLTVERDVESRETTLLEYVRIVHNPLPEVDLEDVSLEKEFCGAKLGAPLMITGMTGGHPSTANINRVLGEVAESLRIAVGVGSQRAGIEDPGVEYTFRVMREAAPTAFVVANLGLPQLAKSYSLREARRAVEMISADALAIHLNVGQELYQAEGDREFSALSKILDIAESLGVPVIVKETGAGLSREAVRLLYRLGIRCFDVSGLGGTSWIKVEAARAGSPDYRPPGELADRWGNPTALAIIETRDAAPSSYIVGSGGVRTGLDAAKAIALGADIAGMARPVLQAVMRGGREAALRFLKNIIYNIKTIILMTGGRRPEDLWRAPITLWGRLRWEAEQRGIDVDSYLLRGRLARLLGVKN